MIAFWWVLIFLMATTAFSAEISNFECNDKKGTLFKVHLKHNRFMEVVEKRASRKISLSEASKARVRKAKPGEPLIYSAIGPKNEPDLSTEFLVQYQVQYGLSAVKILIVVDHQERLGLQCKATGYSSFVQEWDGETSSAGRQVSLMQEFAGLRKSDGMLKPIAILGMETSVRRMLNSEDFFQKSARDEYFKRVTPLLHKIHPESIHEIGKHLDAKAAEFWKTLLAETKYQKASAAWRYATWVREGAESEEKDLASIQVGFSAFYRSHFYSQPDVRNYFANETRQALTRLNDSEAARVEQGLEAEVKLFFAELWRQATGKPPPVDYRPDIERYALEFAASLEGAEFDPRKIAMALALFSKSQFATNPDALALYRRLISDDLKKLSPREQEDVMGWLEGSDKGFFREVASVPGASK